ncbi:DUF1573 domain-containing protein [bacterium]|nr:DUF1573 domain-containing protein [bacterium]MCI0605156.1 DUF1573 domain-containing protein [bacterium]
MKRILPILTVLFFVLNISFAQDGKPNMVIDSEVYDAGQVIRTGAPIEHAFLIKNTGTSQLKILDVRPACGCTVTRYDKVIAPGSEGKIYATVDISHFNGPIQKGVDIRTNDPKRPDTKLTIKATVKSLIETQPDETMRFIVSKGELKTQEMLLTPDPSVKILKPVVDSNMITATLTPQKDRVQKLTVDVKRTDTIGTHSTEVKILTEGPIKEMSIPVVIVVRGPLQVSPSAVSFHVKGYPEEVAVNYTVDVKQSPEPEALVVEKVEAGRKLKVLNESEGWYQVITFEAPAVKGAKPNSPKSVPFRKIGWIKTSVVKPVKLAELPGPKEVSIQTLNGKTFQVLELSSTLAAVKVEKKPNTANPGQFQLSVSLQHVDTSKKGNTRGEILVKTDNADQPQLRIPVFVNVT